MVLPKRLTSPGDFNAWAEGLRQAVAGGALIAGEGIRISTIGSGIIIDSTAKSRTGSTANVSPFVIRAIGEDDAFPEGELQTPSLTCDRVKWGDWETIEESDLKVRVFSGVTDGQWTTRGPDSSLVTLSGSPGTIYTGTTTGWDASADTMELWPFFKLWPSTLPDGSAQAIGDAPREAFLIAAKHSDTEWVDLNIHGRSFDFPYRQQTVCENGEYKQVLLRISNSYSTAPTVIVTPP